MDACPPLEDIAAFLDDMLSAEERARITEHLARCESCYEIFAGAVHFQVEEEKEDSSAEDTGGRGVLPFPLKNEEDRVPRRIPLWLLLAASVVLAVGLGWAGWRSFSPPEITVAGLVEPLEEQTGIAGSLFQSGNRQRGEPDEAALFSSPPVFLTGVYLVDLRLSIQAKEAERAQDALQELNAALAQTLYSKELAPPFKNAEGAMADPAALRRYERTLEDWFAEAEDPFFSFGLWTEAGRLSAVTGSPEFFERRANRRFIPFMARKIQDLQDERYEPILKHLRQIEDGWAEEELLSEQFEDIIDSMEKIHQEDMEDFLSTE